MGEDSILEQPDRDMIGFCGLNCKECRTYIATQSDDEEELTIIASRQSQQFHTEITYEKILCDGCKINKRLSLHCQNSCKIKKCCLEKDYESCIECTTFPCGNERFLIEHTPGIKNNLDELKKY